MTSIFLSLRINDSRVCFLWVVNKGYIRLWKVVVLVWDISYRKSTQNFRKVKVKVSQSCPTRCDPMDDTVHGALQARILEWVACPFSRRSSQPRDQTQISCIAGRFFTNCGIREALEFQQDWSTISFIPAEIYCFRAHLLPTQTMTQELRKTTA